jgi:RNA polymerase sigma-70 factor, ECF subfamily
VRFFSRVPLRQAIRRRESVHASMTARRSADAYKEHSCKDRREVAFSADAHALSALDAHALSALYERFRRPIHSYIYRLLGSQEDADDVTQEVFVRVFIAWNGLHDRDNLSAWLYRIATNLSVDLLRRHKRISWLSLTPDEGFYLPSDDGGIAEIAEREHIRLTIANMPKNYAVALVLHVAQGVPYQEVAAIVGISPTAAAIRISRAKKMFVEHYQRVSQAF